MKETDLYPHVKDFFVQRGYEVKAEIADCDVMAVKDEVVVVCEMKTNLNLQVISQAVERQLLYDVVYVAVPKPKYKKRYTNQYKRTIRVLKKLNLGLLHVDVQGEGSCIEEFPPKIWGVNAGINKYRKQKLRDKALNDFNALTGDYNIGGTVKTKRMTPYKENALLIALYLQILGASRAKELKKLGCGEKTYTIMYKNFYGWFVRLGDGLYDVSNAGLAAIEEYDMVCSELRKSIDIEPK